MLNVFRLFSACFSILLLASCQTSLRPSGFLGEDDARLAKNSQLPFSKSWKNPEVDLSDYSEIQVRPMNMTQLRKLGGISAGNVRNIGGTAKMDADKIAAYGIKELQTTLGESSHRKVTVATSPTKAKDSMVLETNLVELEPGRPAAQVINFLIPFVSIINRPSIGIEGRLVDAFSGATLFAFSDLERGEISLLDFQKFTYYGVQRRELNRWAKQLGQVVDGNGSTVVKDPFVIQPINW